MSSIAAACASTARTLAASQALSPVRVLKIPHLVPYALGTALQEHLYQRRIEARSFLHDLPTPSPASTSAAGEDPNSREGKARAVATTDHLLLLQHAPVFTEGKRRKEVDPELAQACRKMGVDYVLAKRGGLITYHGIGQITGYPSLDLAPMDLSVKCYVSYLETLFRDLLGSESFRLPTVDPPENNTGIWTDEYHKIVALGVQVRHRLTLDGFGFNVSDDPLRFFRMIVACGIQGRHVTSLWTALRRQHEEQGGGGGQVELGTVANKQPSAMEMMPIVSHHFGKQFGRRMEDLSEEHVRYETEASSWSDQQGPLQKATSITLYGERISVPLEPSTF
ncbi:hypothetical protein OC861_004085 [Tilletia horrida]|nr:hypothetical protein OC861_004085 [Tilletia horrida]